MEKWSNNNPEEQVDSERTFDDVVSELTELDKDIIDEEIMSQRFDVCADYYMKLNQLKDGISELINTYENQSENGIAIILINKLKGL